MTLPPSFYPSARNKAIVDYAIATGERPSAIAAKFGLTAKQVRTILHTARSKGLPVKSFLRHGGSPSPNHTTEQLAMKKKIIEMAMRRPRPNSSQIKKALKCPLSLNTIQRVVREHFYAMRDEGFVAAPKRAPMIVRKAPSFQERTIRELIELGVGLTKIAALKRLPYSAVIQVANAVHPPLSTAPL